MEIEGLSRTQLRVPVVQQELAEHTHSARPLHRTKQQVEHARTCGPGLFAPDEGLGDEKDRLRADSLFRNEGLDQVDFELSPSTRLTAEFRRPSKK